ncbi:MAG: sigma-70 family RNA polymerase sigma factor [Pseudomonadota bacterium]
MSRSSRFACKTKPDPIAILGDLDDRALVALVRAAGDAEAFGELFRRHHAPLLAFLSSLGAPLATVDDVLQQTFMTALRKIRQFRGDAAFRTWLFTIGYREHLQSLRRARSGSRLLDSLADSKMPESEPKELLIDDALDLAHALDALAADERTAVLLCDVHGFTHVEAAEMTERPLGTLKSQVRRGHQNLKRLLGMGDQNADPE